LGEAPAWCVVATRTSMSVANVPRHTSHVVGVLPSNRRVAEPGTDCMQACALGRLLHFVCQAVRAQRVAVVLLGRVQRAAVVETC
jgi:hypothetical protein